MSREILEQVLAVLDEVERLEDQQQARSQRMQELVKQARAATSDAERAEIRRQAQNNHIAVVDYGDVWLRIRALRPKVKKALKALPVAQ